jgi:hypothetical protein
VVGGRGVAAVVDIRQAGIGALGHGGRHGGPVAVGKAQAFR